MNRLFQFVTAAALSLAIPASAAPPRYPITRDAIAAAVSDAGMPVTAAQVTPLADVVSLVAAPQLRVRSIEPSGGQTMARMECARSSECLPFVVSIRLERPVSAPAANAAPAAAPAPLLASPISRPAVHSGSAAVLHLDSARVHITVPVICLDNGVTGQTVRATSPDRSKTYVAQVIDSTSLRGTF